MSNNHTHLQVLPFGLALGIIWGVSMFLIGLSTWLFAWGGEWQTLMASVYMGYTPSLLGSLIGGVWGFLDAFIGGIIFAWLYNLFAK